MSKRFVTGAGDESCASLGLLPEKNQSIMDTITVLIKLTTIV